MREAAMLVAIKAKDPHEFGQNRQWRSQVTGSAIKLSVQKRQILISQLRSGLPFSCGTFGFG